MVVRGLYLDRLREHWLPGYAEHETMRSAAESCYLRGVLAPLFSFFEQRFLPVLSNTAVWDPAAKGNLQGLPKDRGSVSAPRRRAV